MRGECEIVQGGDDGRAGLGLALENFHNLDSRLRI